VQLQPRLAAAGRSGGQRAGGLQPGAGRPRVRVNLPDDLPLLHLDAVLIERVLVNLLENAAKYTPAAAPSPLGAEATDVR
jgi:two-component system sensor histidine kinase KdpD